MSSTLAGDLDTLQDMVLSGLTLWKGIKLLCIPFHLTALGLALTTHEDLAVFGLDSLELDYTAVVALVECAPDLLRSYLLDH